MGVVQLGVVQLGVVHCYTIKRGPNNHTKGTQFWAKGGPKGDPNYVKGDPKGDLKGSFFSELFTKSKYVKIIKKTNRNKNFNTGWAHQSFICGQFSHAEPHLGQKDIFTMPCFQFSCPCIGFEKSKNKDAHKDNLYPCIAALQTIEMKETAPCKALLHSFWQFMTVMTVMTGMTVIITVIMTHWLQPWWELAERNQNHFFLSFFTPILLIC